MTAPDERFPRPRALRDRLSRRPRLSPNAAPTQPHLPESRAAVDDEAWFTYTADGDRIVWSEALAALLGRPPRDHELSRQLLARHVHRDDHAKALGSITRAWTAREPVRTTVRLMRADGGWFDVDCRLEPINAPDGTVSGIRGALRDVSARERARREVARLTRRGETVQASIVDPDPATGLLTRARFADEIDRTQRSGGGALLIVRVEPDRADGMRFDLNADLLHRAARVLEGLVRPDDLLGRVGPNEIGVLLPGASWVMARRQADLFVEALRSQPFVLPDAWVHARAWGGLVRFRPHGDAGSHDLLIDAEHAWRQAREADRPLTLVADPVPAKDRQGSYRNRVADALGTDRFTLFAQPILELQTNLVPRHELLLRVLDEHGEPQSPAHVLDTAERLDAVYDIDLWVVERAMEVAASLPAHSFQINLSGRTVGDPRLTAEVEALIERYAVNPEQLTFEITETALIGNLSEARNFADRIRDLGCQLALDDFGSGYASFRYLRLFPIDLVKIDGEYVRNLVNSPQDQVLVRALVQVCQAYGIHTVAEFVQDEATMRMLREFGVDFVQGYLIGRPGPLSNLGPAPRLRRS
ncbi:EAL domain-containing protein [Pseudosporangium ferrugineum]|uniref:PAS domain S-box-containing protein n=1 Tax=Pseudosporangium ferrugineum TaxID=439699 RepID=A0A2T0S384_9ACTN|nr:EAL domain-containing protein [Pseudosporangium ferrugineum]PRY27870.1 PAS domain S-box-containing protein [Pseudosporangium ferrugineum]